MPLLSNKLYILNKVKKDKKDDDIKYCHSLTNEICESEEEMKRKTFLYNQKIWTCRITGQINLTYKEALKSEQGCSKMLKNSFKKCFEATALQFVHHSKESLDTLIHKAWTQIHQEFCVNEPVTIKLTTPKEMILKGVVTKVDRSRSNEDKEQESSPIKLNSDASSSDKENMKKKVIPIKKNYFYSVKIHEMDKIVKDVPAETIERTLRPPSKDQIRMFIRAHAMRHSGKQNFPWVVDEDLVKKYRLPTLEPDFVVDKEKMRQLSLSTEFQVYSRLREEHDGQEGAARDKMCVDLTQTSDDDNDHKKPVNRNSESGKKQRTLKQATLFDIANNQINSNTNQSNITHRTSGSSTIRSPLSSPTRSLPPLAQRLLKLMKENPNDASVRQLIFKCAQLFSAQQINKFPDLIKITIKERKEKLEEKKRLDAMTPAERDAYLTAKRNQIRQQLREKRREENAKLEDNEIEDAAELPAGSPVKIPTELNQDQWARLVSVSEFVRCYKRLLLPNSPDNSIATVETGTSNPENDSKGVISASELCNSVIGGSDAENSVLAELVCVLLKTLLQDNLVRSRKEMGLSLAELPVTPCTAGELLRLVLPLGNDTRVRINDDGDNDIMEIIDNPDETKEQIVNEEINENEMLTLRNNNLIAGPICDKLETQELYDLSIEEKISVLELLQSRILELDIVSSFIDEYQREVCEAYKRKVAETKELNDKLRNLRASKQNMSRPVPITDILAPAPSEDTSQVIRRRHSIEQKQRESEEKERRLERERQFQKLEKEEATTKRGLEQSQKMYQSALNDAKQLMRVQPLGTDRYFRRYWHFSTAPGTLYVENEPDSAEMIDKVLSGAASLDQSNLRVSRWTALTTQEELNDLLSALCDRGIRESALKAELEAVLPQLRVEMEEAVIKATEATITNNNHDHDHECFLQVGFKQELRETEISIRQGSLGGVECYDEWNENLEQAETADELKQSLVAVLVGVHERFWNAPLRSANSRHEFLQAVVKATTQSRLNVLQSFLDACVCWSKSAKDDKCRVCRKVGDENRMLLCDSCNHAFHIFCLRPPLQDIPDGDWFCPHCRPASRARDEEKEKEDKKEKKEDKKEKKDDKKPKKDEEKEDVRKEKKEDKKPRKEEEKDDKKEKKEERKLRRDEEKEDKIEARPTRKRSKIDVKPPSKESEESEEEMEIEVAPSPPQTRRNLKRSSVVSSTSDSSVPVKRSRQSASINGSLTSEKIDKAVQSMLRFLFNHKSSWPFRDPVDPKEVPDYYQIVADPISITEMMEKSKSGVYRSPGNGVKGLKWFLDDIGKMFYNAELYNLPDSEIMKLALSLEEFFKSIYKKYGFGLEYTRRTD